MNEYAIVLTSVDNEAAACAMARHILEKRLAACIQIVAVRSFYVWQGVLEEAFEYRLEIKMCISDYEALETALRAIHPYQTPEIIRIDIAAGSKAYLDWVQAARKT